MDPIIHADIPLRVFTVQIVAGPIVPAVIAGKHAELFRQFVGRLDIPAPLDVCADRFRARALQIPLGVQGLQGKRSTIQHNVGFAQPCAARGVVRALRNIALILQAGSDFHPGYTGPLQARSVGGVFCQCFGYLESSVTHGVVVR